MLDIRATGVPDRGKAGWIAGVPTRAGFHFHTAPGMAVGTGGVPAGAGAIAAGDRKASQRLRSPQADVGDDGRGADGGIHGRAIGCGRGEYRGDDGGPARMAEFGSRLAGALVRIFEPGAAAAPARNTTGAGGFADARERATRGGEPGIGDAAGGAGVVADLA